MSLKLPITRKAVLLRLRRKVSTIRKITRTQMRKLAPDFPPNYELYAWPALTETGELDYTNIEYGTLAQAAREFDVLKSYEEIDVA